MDAERRMLSVAGLVGALASACAVALLGTAAWLIATAAGAPPVLTLTVAAVMVRAFALGRAFLRYVERLIGHDAALRALTGLRVRVYCQLERLAPSGLAGFARGDLLTRLIADVDSALDLPLRVVLPWAQAVLVSAGTVAFCVWINTSSGLILGCAVVAGLILTPWAVAAVASRTERRLAPSKALLASTVVTALDASADLIAFGEELTATRRIAAIDADVTALTLRASAALGIGSGLGVLIQGLAVLGVLVVSIPEVRQGSLQPVWLAVLVLVPLALFEVLAPLPGSALAYQRLRGSAARLDTLEGISDPVTEPAVPLTIPPGFSGLELRGVSAGWGASEARALCAIDLRVRAGEHLVIVGPSGAGKSTLAAVLMGFLAYEGSIKLNGIELSAAGSDGIRERIGLLAQRSHVFGTTIAENVRLGRPGLSDTQVWRALAAARLDESVRRMPGGLDAEVGPLGMRLSGGESQRLALARILIDPPPLLILDEPTEHLDGVTAEAIERMIRAATAASTRITITHRLRGINTGDHVIVLREGRIEAEGMCDELARGGGWFADQLRTERDELEMSELMEGLPVGVAVIRVPPSGGIVIGG
jgi:ATP-binding cassette subfamily C protein CydCD